MEHDGLEVVDLVTNTKEFSNDEDEYDSSNSSTSNSEFENDDTRKVVVFGLVAPNRALAHLTPRDRGQHGRKRCTKGQGSDVGLSRTSNGKMWVLIQ